MGDEAKLSRWMMVLVIVWIVLAVAIIWCLCVRRPSGTDVVVRFTCPGDPVVVDVVDRATGAVVSSATGIAVSEPITDIPEFHDCQRFLGASGYDSLYAIFASFRLDSLQQRWARDTAAALYDGRPYGLVPAATIYSHGGHYPALGIEPGFNCLFFYKPVPAPGAVRKWAARMVPWGGSANPDCSDFSHDAYATGTELQVDTVFDAALRSADYAPVARWDWDDTTGQHYIGIACGKVWCEVGAMGFHSSAGYSTPALSWGLLNGSVPSSTSPEYMRVTRVKGWHDAQVLEKMSSGIMMPSPTHGYLIPHPGLEATNNLTDAGGNNGPALAAYKNKWSHVANAIVEGGDYPKWNLKTGGQNEVWFCYGTPDNGSCDISNTLRRAPGSSTPLLSCPADPNDTALRWWARIVSAAKDTAYTCIRRTNHANALKAYKALHTDQTEIRIPGAARWRFVPSDAGEWIACPSGCCTKQ